MCGQLPELQVLEQMAVLLGHAARDRREAPVHVRLVELGGPDPRGVENVTELLKLLLVADRQVDVRRVVVGRATELVGVFESSVCCLDRLLREWEIAAGDGVEVAGGDLQLLHDELRWLMRLFRNGEV